MTKLDLTDRPRLYRALLFGLVAASLLTYASHWKALRFDRNDHFWEEWSLSEYSLNSTLGIKKSPNCRFRDVPGDINAQQQTFIDTIAQRIHPYVSDPKRTYDVRLYTCCRFGRGWPWQTVVYSATIVINAEGAGRPITRDILYADENGLPPERPAAWVYNGLFFFICASLVFWFVDKHVKRLAGKHIAEWKTSADAHLKTLQEARSRGLVTLALSVGLLTTAYTSVKVRQQTPLPFVVTGSQFTLNSAVGLSSEHFPKEQDPLSGDLEVDRELYELCQRVADDAKPLIPHNHTKRAQVLLVIREKQSKGWPLTTYETAARVLIQDQASRLAMKRWEDYMVDARGASPFQWLGILGNWLLYSAVAYPLLLLAERLIAELLRRFTRRQRAFPIIITDEQPSESSEVPEPPTEE